MSRGRDIVIRFGKRGRRRQRVRLRHVGARWSAVPLPGSDVLSVDLNVRRRDGGTGSTLVSSAIPLPQGTLFDTDAVRLLVNGSEQQVAVRALEGRWPDGSIISLLVQCNLNLRGSLSGQLRIGEPRGTRDIAEVTPPRDPPASLWPSSPDYLVSTRLFGPTLTVADTPLNRYDDDFDTRFHHSEGADLRSPVWTECNSGSVTYDPPLILVVKWMRSGDESYLDNAIAKCINIYDEYYGPNNGGVPFRWMGTRGMAAWYWLTGHEDARRMVGRFATVAWGPGTQAEDRVRIMRSHSWMEGRILSRDIEAGIYAWLLGENASTYARRLPDYLDAALENNPLGPPVDGLWGSQVCCGGMNVFMLGMICHSLSLYYDRFNADRRIPDLIKRCLDFVYPRHWGPHSSLSSSGFSYWRGSDPNQTSCEGVGGVGISVDGVTGFWPHNFGWYWDKTGDSAYRDAGDIIMENTMDGSWDTWNFRPPPKQFWECYTMSFSFWGYR